MDDYVLTPLCTGCWSLIPAGTPYTLVQVRHMERAYTVPYCRTCRSDGPDVTATQAATLTPQQLALFAEEC